MRPYFRNDLTVTTVKNKQSLLLLPFVFVVCLFKTESAKILVLLLSIWIAGGEVAPETPILLEFVGKVCLLLGAVTYFFWGQLVTLFIERDKKF